MAKGDIFSKYLGSNTTTSPNFITPHILLGDRKDASNLNALRKNGVTHVLNTAKQLPNYFPDQFIYCNLAMIDNEKQDLMPYLDKAVKFQQHCEQVGGRCLVHCIAGVSRSTSCVLAYLMTEKKQWLFEAFNHCKAQRSIVHPNEGFRLTLARYEVSILGASSVATVPAGHGKAGKMWNFYSWNVEKQKVKKHQCHEPLASILCVVL